MRRSFLPGGQKLKRRSWGPMLMEILIALLIFSLVSAVSLAFFVRAREMNREAAEKAWASDRVSDVSEILRSSSSIDDFSGRLEKAFPGMRETRAGKYSWIQWYDSSMTAINDGKGSIALKVTASRDEGMIRGRIVIKNVETGDTIYSSSCSHYAP
jgi:hypothetical protein